MTAQNLPQASLPEIDLSENVATYLIYLVWSDDSAWSPRRQVTRQEALAFAETLTAHLPPAAQERLERYKSSRAA